LSTPYATAALAYLGGGLGSPIPSMFPFEKHPPLTGWTGRSGMVPNERTVQAWTETHENSNVLIRMAPDVIGIDVDDYDNKHGGASMVAIIERHGPIPYTHVSTARDLPSGIYWFRLTSWMESDKMRDPGEHVEVIRHEHRYAVAPPSWNSKARAYYRWVDGVTPTRDDLGHLPIEWYVHLTRGCDCFALERAERRQMMQRLNNRPKGEAGRLAARKDLDKAVEALRLSSAGTRNNMLSSIAGRFLLYDVVMNNVLTSAEVTSHLSGAAHAAGLDIQETWRTLESAMAWALREGATK
jgi:hypothetical protein